MNFAELQKAYVVIPEDDHDHGEAYTIIITIILDERWRNKLKLNGIKSPCISFTISLCLYSTAFEPFYNDIRLYTSGDNDTFIVPISAVLPILKAYSRDEYENIIPYYIPKHSKFLMDYHINIYQKNINYIEKMKKAL